MTKWCRANRKSPEDYPLEEIYSDKEKIEVIIENLTSEAYCSGIAELTCKPRPDKTPEEVEVCITLIHSLI